MMDLKSIARRLGGEVISGAASVPGPGHSKHDRSLRVFLDPTDRDGFRVQSFANDNWRACREHVKQRLGIADAPSRRKAPTSVGDDERRVHALELFRDAGEARGTIVEAYLAGRGLKLPANELEVIRFAPRCPFKLNNGSTVFLPSMVALFRDIVSNRPVAIHRTAVKPDGSGKVIMPDGSNPKKMLGPARGAAIKLDEDASVEFGLHLGEGIETCLAVRQLGYRPAWVAGSAGQIASFPVLPGIEAITLLEETDKTGANARAVAECAKRWLAAGKEALALRPIHGGDCNDALQRLR
jgi:hypothetical protein